ncbi:MAG: hypothetical protein ABSC94_14085 [Polyangiaceae bacterium]
MLPILIGWLESSATCGFVAQDDGVTFDPKSATAQRIKEDAE